MVPSLPFHEFVLLELTLILLFFVFFYQPINRIELTRPSRIVQEWSKIESIVIRAVALRMIARRQCAHLVPIDGIVKEEALHLFGYFTMGHQCGSTISIDSIPVGPL